MGKDFFFYWGGLQVESDELNQTIRGEIFSFRSCSYGIIGQDVGFDKTLRSLVNTN